MSDVSSGRLDVAAREREVRSTQTSRLERVLRGPRQRAAAVSLQATIMTTVHLDNHELPLANEDDDMLHSALTTC